MRFKRLRAALLAAALVASAPAARAASAVAIGDAGDASKHGLASGLSYGYGSRPEAEGVALRTCRTTKDAPQTTRALCRIVAHFDNQCAAIAIDPAPSTPGWGWAIGATPAEAGGQATRNCRKIAGPVRANFCVVLASECDGAALHP